MKGDCAHTHPVSQIQVIRWRLGDEGIKQDDMVGALLYLSQKEFW